MKNILRIIIRFIFKIYSLIVYRPEIIGKENIPKTGAALICPNHVHALDSALIIAEVKRKVNCLAKEELFPKGIAKWFAGVFGLYPIKQDYADVQAIKTSLKLLKNNELLMIFPEGTRNGLEKGIKPKNGAISLAIKADVPIIPVGIIGNFKSFKKIVINIGKPKYYFEWKNSIKNKEILDDLTKRLIEDIIILRDFNK